MKPLCKHCGIRRCHAPRGLCKDCYLNPVIKPLYPLLSEGAGFNSLSDDDFNGGYVLPAEPTDSLPGTEERIAALAARAEQRVALRHPGDAVWDEKEAHAIPEQYEYDDEY